MNDIFANIVQPPPKIKEEWRKMIPEWAWRAMQDDVKKIMVRELPRKTPVEDIERMIRNKHVFISREAFFPYAFLTDIVEIVNKEMNISK